MKIKLIAFLVLFFAFSLISWGEPKGDSFRQTDEVAGPKWPEISNCSTRDEGAAPFEEGGRGVTSRPAGRILSARANPLESAFFELSCLLASN